MTAPEYQHPPSREGHDRAAGETPHAPARVDFERELTRRALRGTLFGVTEPVRLGRFELMRVLGRGSVGLVCEALDSESGRRVALKILERVDSKQVYRLKREFRSLAALRHPNLVAIHELFRAGDEWFFSMELVAGISFERWVRPGGQLDEGRLRDALCQLVDAVECIHAAGRVHCDLKPGNVLVADRARVVVLDFGLCREHGLEPRPRAANAEITGTPAYMAPEQVAGEAAGVHSDWYALGVMLFEALTDRLPFDGDGVQVLHDKQRLEAPDPRDCVADPLPHDLCQVCRGLLRRDAASRFGSQQLRAGVGRLGAAQFPVGPDATAGLAGSPDELVGRQRELQVLLDELAAARGQQPRAVLIRGGCGVGKSALLDGFARLTASSALVLRGTCRAHEALPYKVFDELMDGFGQHMAELRSAGEGPPHPLDDDGVRTLELAPLLALFPALGQLIGATQPRAAPAAQFDPARLRFEALGALCQLFARWVQSRAVILLVDDLQWGDVDSARLLRQLLQLPQPLPLLFVGALRDEEPTSEFLHAFGHEQGHEPGPSAAYEPRSIELGALEQLAAERLAQQRLTAAASQQQADATGIAREAQGLPYFIGVLAEHATGSAPRAGTWPHARLADVLLGRSQALPEAARRMLQVLSVAAGPLELSLVRDTAHLHGQTAQWPAALSALLHGRWIRLPADRAGSAPQADVYHPRIRDAVLSAMPADQRRSLHAQIARTMERERRVFDERLLVHLLAAGEVRQAGLAAIPAAHRAMGELNFGLAARLFERAIDLLAGEDPRRGELYEHLGDALARLDEAPRAAGAYLSASQLQVAESSLRLRALAAQQFLRCAQLERGKTLACSALHGLGLADLAAALGEQPAVALATVPTRGLWSRARFAWRGVAGGVRRMTRQSIQSRTCDDVVAALWLELSLLEPQAGAALHASFERQARRARDPLAQLSAGAWRIARSAMPGSPGSQRRARRALPKLQALGAASATPRAAALYATADAAAHLFAGRYAAALASACRADELLAGSHAGAAFERAWVASLRHAALEFAGDLRQMALDANERARVARRRDDWLTAAVLVPSLANAQLVAGEPGAALALLERERGAIPVGLPLTRPLIASRSVDAWLYQDQPARALQFMRSAWPELEQTHLRRGAWQRALCYGARVRGGLAVFRHEPSPKLRRSIEYDLRVLARQPCAAGLAHALTASFHHQLGDDAGAIDRARRALARFELDGADRAALYARRRLGELIGGVQGESLIASADRALAAQLLDPARWVAIHLGAL